MAHRDDVTPRSRCRRPCRHSRMALLVILTWIVSGCSSSSPPQETVNRGQVIDVDTELPIAGAIVVGKYSGGRGFEGASSCNRVETAVSDQNGWFELPLDPQAGFLLMEAYHRGYRHGWPIRVPTCGINGHPEQCQIWQDRRDDSDHVVSIVKEPKIYHGEAEATKASRYWQDVYLKPFKGTREQRLEELWRLPAANSCLAPPKSSPGLEPFLQAILQEQIELGDSADAIRTTKQRIETVKEAMRRKK